MLPQRPPQETAVPWPGSSRAPPGEHRRITPIQPTSGGMTGRSRLVQKTRRFWRCRSPRGAQPSSDNMMSAIETGAAVYPPAQLLNWVYMSLQDPQSSAFDAFKAESDTSPRDMSNSKRSAADLSSNYLNNFFHLRSEVEVTLHGTLTVFHMHALLKLTSTVVVDFFFFFCCISFIPPRVSMNTIPSYFTRGYFCSPYSKPHLHAFIGSHCGEWLAYEYVFCTLVYCLSVFRLFSGVSVQLVEEWQVEEKNKMKLLNLSQGSKSVRGSPWLASARSGM